MKRLLATTLSLLIVLTVFAQRTETRRLDPFSEISVSEAITVELRKGDSPQAIVEIDGAELEDVRTEVMGDRLKVEMADRRGNYKNVDVMIIVTYTELEEIDVSSASDVYSQGIITAKNLELEVSSAGDMELEIDVDLLDVRVSSAGDLELSGKANEQSVRVSSAGDYDGEDLISAIARVDVSSSGDARITVTEELDADASSGGTVRYEGNPGIVFADSSSGGKVKKG